MQSPEMFKNITKEYVKKSLILNYQFKILTMISNPLDRV